MTAERPVVIVTGVSGNLGRRLLSLLRGFEVVGMDMEAPQESSLPQFHAIDFGAEASCEQLASVLRDTEARAVVHLAFVVDPVRTGILDPERMWQINVAGTARVMEAISVVNRYGGQIEKFIFPSSTAVYGPETPPFVTEEHPLRAESLPYAVHKQECDKVVRYRQEWMTGTRTYLLRTATLAGASVQNYMLGALRGIPGGTGHKAERMRKEGKRLPLVLPWGHSYLENKLQFVHVDDMARLIAYLLHRDSSKDGECNIFNVAGSGDPVSLEQCVEMGRTRIRRVPSRMFSRVMLKRLWDWKISSFPPDALPYLLGSCTVDTNRLRKFLGNDYADVFRFSAAEALADSFREEQVELFAQ